MISIFFVFLLINLFIFLSAFLFKISFLNINRFEKFSFGKSLKKTSILLFKSPEIGLK